MAQLIELGEYRYRILDGHLHTNYNSPLLAAKFPIFARACVQFAEAEGLLNAYAFITTSIHTFLQPTNKSKQFQVYRHLAWAARYKGRQEFPNFVEKAIKDQWHDEGKQYVGYKPSNNPKDAK